MNELILMQIYTCGSQGYGMIRGVNFGGQRSRSQKAVVELGGVAKTSLLTLWSKVKVTEGCS